MRLVILALASLGAYCQSRQEEGSVPVVELFTENATEIQAANYTGMGLLEGSGMEIVEEGSGEIFVEQFRFVLPVRKRRDAEDNTTSPRTKRDLPNSIVTAAPTTPVDVVASAELVGDGSGDYAYEIGVRELGREKRDTESKSSSENISIDLPAPGSRKRRDSDDLKKVVVSSAAAKVMEDASQLKEDERVLNAAIKALQSAQDVYENSTDLSSLENVTFSVSTVFPTTSAAAPLPCISDTTCHNDGDCNGGTCQGNFLGTCNCNACLNFWQCYSDSDCGGFNRACNLTTNMCNCFGAFVLNGFDDTLDALAHLCNVKKCHPRTASSNCFGLPCNVGRCSCD